MNHETNRSLYQLLGKELVDAAVHIAGDKRIRFTTLQHERNGLLYQLLGKTLVDAAVEIADNSRIRFTAIQHEGRLMEMEEELAKNKHPDRISGKLGMTERTVRRHRDD